MKINQLPESLANKIAAGEVVERPASVIKELVENSIDANSTYIKVELFDAGLIEIKVTDNGEGMVEEDCKRAFLRHATSKIKYDSDLFRIKSLGFRGEALASIASVSKLTITSSTGDEAGTKLYLEGGKIVKQSKGDARQGTEIIVRELFYNTPARLKYVKSLHTELGHTTDFMNRFALSHPEIRFELFHNDKKVFVTTGSGNRLQVMSQIYGIEVAKNVIQAETSTDDFKVEAYIVKPEITRANRKYITFIVNGRYIRNYALTDAIIRGYDTLLTVHRYPIALIYITIDPLLVDVNVHPTKMEIRFSKERELVQAIERMVRSAFKQATLIPSIKREKRERIISEQPSFQFEPKQDEPKVFERNSVAPTSDRVDKNETNQLEHEDVVSESIASTIVNQIESGDNNDESKKDNRLPALYPIGQLQGTYILAQNELGFYMIDQHAAQERIKYEYFKTKLNEPINDTQALLMPLTFEFTTDEIILIEKYRQELENAGVFLEPFGGQTYAVRSHPTWFPKGLEDEIIRDIIHEVIQEGKIHIGKMRDELAALMACKRSIKANHALKIDEMERLLHDLRQTENPFTCPHGRPVIIHFSYYEIEKMFKRIM